MASSSSPKSESPSLVRLSPQILQIDQLKLLTPEPVTPSMATTPTPSLSPVRLQPLNPETIDRRIQVVFEQEVLLRQIFSHIRSYKEKCRLGRVCRLFQRALARPAAWSHNETLCLIDHTDSENALSQVLLNNESVNVSDLPTALAYLLSRITLKTLKLGRCNSDLVYEMVLARMCSAEIMPEIQTLTLSGRSKDTNVMPFIWASQKTLRSLHFGNCVFSSRVRVVEFWRSVQACHKLQEFRHLSFRLHVDSISLEEDIVNALKGKKLHTLYLLALRNLSPNGLTTLLRSIPARSLRRLSLSHSNVSLRTIRDQVDDAHRLGLREFRFGPFPADGTDDQLAVSIPLIFPNLRKCILEAQALTFPSNTVVETIDRFLSHIEAAANQRKAPSPSTKARSSANKTKLSSSPPMVTLCMSIYFQHLEVLEKVLGRIVREKRCSVTPVRYCNELRDGYLIERNGVKVLFYDYVDLIDSD